MAKKKYDDYFLQPEITQAGEFQVFTLKGKDARGYDYKVRLAAISDETYPGDIVEKADCDRIEMYLGGNPDAIEKVPGELEVTLGDKACRIDKATMVYVPKGVPVKHRIVKKPDDIAWLLNFNLTPKQENADAQKGESK